MLKTKRCEGVVSRAGGAVEAKRDHTGVFCCIDDAAATVHSPACVASAPAGMRAAKRSDNWYLGVRSNGSARVDRQGAPAIFRRLRDLALGPMSDKPLWRNW